MTMILEGGNSSSTTTVDWSDHDENSSVFSSKYTYSNDKYSCLEEFYHVHMFFNYVIFLSGIACMLTRLIPASWNRRYNLHSWFGRIYILSMLWTTSASLLINNDGLPVAVLVSFAAVMGGLTIGWIVIVLHKQNLHKQATEIVQNDLIEKMKLKQNHDENDNDDINLNEMMADATDRVVNSKTFAQRFFSLKSLHGILFFVSWMQISGRMFNKGDGQFACRTYPVNKPIDAPHIPDEAVIDAENNELMLVPVHDPYWNDLPWSDGPVVWALLIIVASLVIALLGGAALSFLFAWRASKSQSTNNKTDRVGESRHHTTEEEDDTNNEDGDSSENNVDKKTDSVSEVEENVDDL